MAYDTTEAVAKFLSGFQMKITNRERDTVPRPKPKERIVFDEDSYY